MAQIINSFIFKERQSYLTETFIRKQPIKCRRHFFRGVRTYIVKLYRYIHIVRIFYLNAQIFSHLSKTPFYNI